MPGPARRACGTHHTPAIRVVQFEVSRVLRVAVAFRSSPREVFPRNPLGNREGTSLAFRGRVALRFPHESGQAGVIRVAMGPAPCSRNALASSDATATTSGAITSGGFEQIEHRIWEASRLGSLGCGPRVPWQRLPFFSALVLPACFPLHRPAPRKGFARGGAHALVEALDPVARDAAGEARDQRDSGLGVA